METKIEFSDKTIFCRQGDIADSEAVAIVNAANNHLWMGSGVAGAIKRKGGQVIEDEAIKQGPIEIGEAVVTGGGKLAAKYVIHAAVMGQDLRTNAEIIRKTTNSVLIRAEKHNISSLDFPALGTGVGGFPLDSCAEIMIGEVYKYLQISKGIKSAGFVLYDKGSYEIFRKALERYRK